MSAALSVAVLVSAGCRPMNGKPRASQGDAAAMAIGRALAGNRLRVIHAGSSDEPSLQDYLAYGAEKIEVVAAEPGTDPVSALAPVLAGTDLILTGNRAEQGPGSGLLPYALAEALGRPIVANALEVAIESGANGPEARIRQFLPKGQRRQLAAPLPLVISIHPFAPVKLTYAYARRMSGAIDVTATAEPQNGIIHPAWTVEVAPRRAIRLKAQDKKAGHARLLSAIVSEAKSGVVAFDGTTVDKAQVVLNYLREHRLVDF